MADKNIAWYDWRRYKEEKARKENEYAKRLEERESRISWDLSDSLMPVTLERHKVGYNTYTKKWYVKGSTQPSSFIYLLIELDTKEVKYVGVTDEPTRRYNQHKANNRIGINKFYMSIVDVGWLDAEQKWINELTQKGHKLLNLNSAVKTSDSGTELF